MFYVPNTILNILKIVYALNIHNKPEYHKPQFKHRKQRYTKLNNFFKIIEQTNCKQCLNLGSKAFESLL